MAGLASWLSYSMAAHAQLAVAVNESNTVMAAIQQPG